MDTTTTARDRVFALPELLVAILSAADIRTLASATAVSKHIKKVIEESAELQQQLFYKARPVVRACNIAGEMVPQMLVNPALLPSDPVQFNNPISPKELVKGVKRFDLDYRLNAVAASPDSTCRNMFLTDPPVTTAEIAIITDTRIGITLARKHKFEWRLGFVKKNARCFWAPAHQASGIRLRDVLDVIEDIDFGPPFKLLCQFESPVNAAASKPQDDSAESRLVAHDSATLRGPQATILVICERHGRLGKIKRD